MSLLELEVGPHSILVDLILVFYVGKNMKLINLQENPSLIFYPMIKTTLPGGEQTFAKIRGEQTNDAYLYNRPRARVGP